MLFKKRGFSLIELLVVVALIAIITTVALPSYQNSVAKSRRAEAAAVLLEAAQALERYYSVNGRYLKTDGSVPAVFPAQVPASGTAYYNIADTGDATNNSFLLRATRAGVMAGDECGDFQIDHAGSRTLNGATASAADCWRR